jgi:hypothetical protein
MTDVGALRNTTAWGRMGPKLGRLGLSGGHGVPAPGVARALGQGAMTEPRPAWMRRLGDALYGIRHD